MHEDPRSARRCSLAGGGPVHSLWLRIGVIGHDGLDVARLSALVMAVLWLPLVAIAAVERTVHGQWPALILEPSVHARFLIALPLLALAERVEDHLGVHATQRLIDDGYLVEGDAALARAMKPVARLRDSPWVEAILLVVAMVGSQVAVAGLGPWHRDPEAMPPFSITRVWYSFVALPAFQLMMYRALWRWLLWSWLLARISRERLRPEPAHPDGSGGLGFLGDGALRFAPVAAAYSVVLAGAWGGLILHRDARFVDFHDQLITYVAIVTLVAVLPLVVLAPQLVRARLHARREYAGLSTEFVRLFHRRWIERRPGAELLDNPNIESLECLGGIYRRVARMRLVPVSPLLVIRFAIWPLVPMVPLLLSEVPVAALARRVASVLVGKLG